MRVPKFVLEFNPFIKAVPVSVRLRNQRGAVLGRILIEKVSFWLNILHWMIYIW